MKMECLLLKKRVVKMSLEEKMLPTPEDEDEEEMLKRAIAMSLEEQYTVVSHMGGRTFWAKFFVVVFLLL